MNCLFCNAELVERRPMNHDTRKGTRSKIDRRPPKKGWWCPVCKRVQRGQ